MRVTTSRLSPLAHCTCASFAVQRFLSNKAHLNPTIALWLHSRSPEGRVAEVIGRHK